MKKSILLFSMVFIGIMPYNLTGQSLFKKKIISSGKMYLLEITQQLDKKFKIIITKTDNGEFEELTLSIFEIDSFEDGVINVMKKLGVTKPLPVQPDLREVFIEAEIATLQDDPLRPVACIITINDTVPILEMPNRSSKQLFDSSLPSKPQRKRALNKAYLNYEVAEQQLNELKLTQAPNIDIIKQAEDTVSVRKKELRNAFLNFKNPKDIKEQKLNKVLDLFDEEAKIKRQQAFAARDFVTFNLNEIRRNLSLHKTNLENFKERYNLAGQAIIELSAEKNQTEKKIEKAKIDTAVYKSLREMINIQQQFTQNELTRIKRELIDTRSEISALGGRIALSTLNAQIQTNEETTLINLKKLLIQSQRDSTQFSNIPRLQQRIQEHERTLLQMRQNYDRLTELIADERALKEQQEQDSIIYQKNFHLDISLRDSIIAKQRAIAQLKPLIEQNEKQLKIELNRSDTLFHRVAEEQIEIDRFIHEESKMSSNAREKAIEAHLADENQPRDTIIIEYVQMEFADGYMENILALGHLKENEPLKLKFENLYPIGFSTKKNFEEIGEVSLYEQEHQKLYRMKMGDLLPMIEQNHHLLTKDYSPENQVVKIRPPVKKIALYKGVTGKLFEAQFFTDPIGFKEFNPNGLVQTLANRRIPLRTKRFAFFSYRHVSFGYLAYVEPMVAISKFEQKERFLPTDSKDEIQNNALFSRKFATTIQLKAYENFSTGFDLNFALLDFPNFKSTLLLDLGFRYGRISIVDSLRIFEQGQIITSDREPDKYSINTYQLYPKFIWKILPDPRYGFSLSYQWNLFILRDNRLQQVNNREAFLRGDELKDVHWLGTFQIGGFYKPEKEGENKIFFRYLFHHQLKQWNTNFDQLQLGYSFSLTFPQMPASK